MSTKFKKYLVLIPLVSVLIFQACERTDYSKREYNYHQRTLLTKDELKTLELTFKNLRMKKNEFTKFTWYQDKSSPIYVNKNGFVLYFGVRDDGFVTDLKLQIQYYAEDWLFIQSYAFIVDTTNFSLYTFDRVDRDNGDGGMIWEWYDTSVGEDVMKIIKAISKSKKVKIRFNGRQYYMDKTLTRSEINAVNNVLNIYENIRDILSRPPQGTDTLKYSIK